MARGGGDGPSHQPRSDRFPPAFTHLSLGAARLDEDGEVSDLVRDLVQQDGKRGYRADRRAYQEGRAHGQAIGEVVDEVGRQVQVTRHLDVTLRKGQNPRLG